MSRIRGPYVRFCERDEAVTPHPTRYWKTPGGAVQQRSRSINNGKERHWQGRTRRFPRPLYPTPEDRPPLRVDLLGVPLRVPGAFWGALRLRSLAFSGQSLGYLSRVATPCR